MSGASHPADPSRGPANPHRGEAELAVGPAIHILRPSFGALVAAEEELGSLYALVERAGGGNLRLAEVAALFWHCMAPESRPLREAVGAAVVARGLAGCAQPLRILLAQILKGAG